MTIGFIGQGFVGKNYADLIEERGHAVVRYALEEPYQRNKEAIATCDLVIIAVPTPTTPAGCDLSMVEDALTTVGAGKIAVIKSTMVPGSTKKLQEKFSDLTILFSPEFLSEATAAHDVRNPFANVIGMSVDDAAHRGAAGAFEALLPEAPFSRVMGSTEAELFKYGHNGSGYVQILFFNALYDLAETSGAKWQDIEDAIQADPFIPNRYAKPLHKSGRGAGGKCFVKDFAALRITAETLLGKEAPLTHYLAACEAANRDLLAKSGKDADIVKGVYG